VSLYGVPPPPAQPPAGPPPTGPRGGIRLGRVLGVPVFLAPSWLLLGVLITWVYGGFVARTTPGLPPAAPYLIGLGFVACLMVSVFLHELGHAATALRFGLGVRTITFEFFGGYTEMSTEPPGPKIDLLVSVAGPAVSAVLGLAAAGAAAAIPDDTVAGQFAFQLAASNLIVAVFNLLPGLPLDGGRALRAIVWAVSGSRHRGTSVAGWSGRVLALAALGAAGVLFYTGRTTALGTVLILMVVLTLWQGAGAAIRYGRIATRLPRVDLRRLTRPVFEVPMGTPLAEATRRLAGSPDPHATVGVTDGSGALVAVLHDRAVAAVPVERRPWVPVESVARTLDRARALGVEMSGEEVVRAVQANPAANYLVLSGEEVVGVLRAVDLARMLQS